MMDAGPRHAYPRAVNTTHEPAGAGRADGMDVLVADDEKTIQITLRDALEEAGHRVVVAPDGLAARAALEERAFDVVVTDLKMPGMPGLEVLRLVKSKCPDTEVIVMTGFGTVETAVDAMKLGAYEYLLKPFPHETVVLLLRRIAEQRRLVQENRALREELGRSTQLEGILGQSRAMREVFQTIRLVAPGEARVLITGESGTGKELVARAIHHLSPRRAAPLVAISCASVPETLLEDTLFGHERGAFTDAKDKRVGKFEHANGGTVFLDDIDDMPLATQVKLLRVLQEGEVERIGSAAPVHVDVRVLAATKVDLEDAVNEGRFRRDLFYRLNVVPVRLPPLRDREDDIKLLAQHFIESFGRGRPYRIEPDVMDAMMRYTWPGNVRELEHAVERAIAMSGGNEALRKEHLVGTKPLPERRALPDRVTTLADAVADAERAAIRAALEHTRGRKAEAAAVLGISRKNLWEKMKHLGIEAGEE
ncbi:MAG: Transcriptional regulatory protein ZraR [Planctomycetes bacterium]|nr:Transcriptional regulatory protein ZraR [Planctomycetota bacterium]